MQLTPIGLDTPECVESLFAELQTAILNRKSGPLILDLSSCSFIPSFGLIAIITTARHWHGQTGSRTIAVGMSQSVHAYLERMNLFTACWEWLEQSEELAPENRFDRRPYSPRLLEVMPISGDEAQNADDVGGAVERAQFILATWFPSDREAVRQLATVLTAIAENIVHSRDRGFATIQRYTDRTNRPSGSLITIAVGDLGIGIERSLRNKRRFRRSTNSRRLRTGSDYILCALELGVTSRNTVAGMGLHQVKHIVEDWRGTLSLRSRSSLVHFEDESVIVCDDLAEIPGTQVTITVRDHSDVERE
jgi:signal transduction histidine kinase